MNTDHRVFLTLFRRRFCERSEEKGFPNAVAYQVSPRPPNWENQQASFESKN